MRPPAGAKPAMTLRMRIGGNGPVVLETGGGRWRLIVEGRTVADETGPLDGDDALRDLALRRPDLAADALATVMNLAGTWEDDFTEEHGAEALDLEHWLERLRTHRECGWGTGMDEETGGLFYYSLSGP